MRSASVAAVCWSSSRVAAVCWSSSRVAAVCSSSSRALVVLFIGLVLLLFSPQIRPLGDLVAVDVPSRLSGSVRTTSGLIIPSGEGAGAVAPAGRPLLGRLVAAGPRAGDVVAALGAATGTATAAGLGPAAAAETLASGSLSAGVLVLDRRLLGAVELTWHGHALVLVRSRDVLGRLPSADAGLSSLEPAPGKVLVRMSEVSDRSAGGVLLLESAKPKPATGAVVRIGRGWEKAAEEEGVDAEARRILKELAEGDVICFFKHAGDPVEERGSSDRYVVLRARDVLGSIQKDQEST